MLVNTIGISMTDEPGTEGDLQEPLAYVLITLMRIYDVQMALLAKDRPDMAKHIAEMHDAGQIVNPLPKLALEEDNNAD